MIIPRELDFIIKNQKRKDVVNRILKVYQALLYKKNRSKNWFDVPSNYLEKVNSRYYKAIQLFIEYGIIEYKSSGNEFKYKDIFSSESYKKKSYNKTQSMKYRFIIDIEDGYEFDIDIPSNLYDNEKWFIKTKYSLLKLGFREDELSIKRDSFSRRLHTNITGFISQSKSYKELLKGGDYYSIDGKSTQPRLLWIHLKDIGLNDFNLNYIFDNNIDFYEYLIENIPVLKSRDEAKELFASWINGTGYLDIELVGIRNLFKVANTFVRCYKSSSYKNICRLLQHKEASIFIDDLLNNCPVDFCLSVHDSIVVKKEDVDVVLSFCESSRPEIRFEVSEIKIDK